MDKGVTDNPHTYEGKNTRHNTVNHVFLAGWNFSEFIIFDILAYCIISVYKFSDFIYLYSACVYISISIYDDY